MKINLPIIPATAAISLALVLSACGKQEAVGDVPSSEELAKQADAATQLIRDEAAEADSDAADKATADAMALIGYNNALRGYTIMVPENWPADEAAGDDNGQVFKAPEEGGTLTVGWTENRDNADFTAAIETITKAGDAMSGKATGENQYRASGTNADGEKTMVRLLRQADGSMVRASIDYPADSSKAVDMIAKQIIDSLALK